MDDLQTDVTQVKNRSESDIIKILVVKAAEENSKRLFAPLTISSANISAIGAKSDFDFIQKRASFLFTQIPASSRELFNFYGYSKSWMRWAFAVSIFIGVLSNYLGPQKLIHVVYNPLTILIAWNVLKYLFMVVKGLWKIPKNRTKNNLSNTDEPQTAEKEDNAEIPTGFLMDKLAGGLYKLVFRLKARFTDDNTKLLNLNKIIPAFWADYKIVADEVILHRLKGLMNVAAIGLLVGAIIGVYFRGLFFNYNMIWLSTFVTEPGTIQNILNIFFGFANLAIEGNWIDSSQVNSLMDQNGAPAGPWIHKMALTCLLVIFIPRFVLALHFLHKANRSLKPLDIEGSYYQDNILSNREKLVELISEGIHEIISKKITKTGKTISEFVIKDYYEKIIAPILIAFREKGGKIRKLENELFASQEKFEPILLSYLREVQEDFRDTVLTELNLFLGRKLEIDINTMSSYQPRSDELDRRLTGKIAADIGDTIGGTIVTTVSLAAGSISGGIGKSLGIAIISGLLGVSGPLGLLIGGLITAITLGGVYKLKREQISGMIKDVPLPAIAIKATLTDAKIEKTRKETYTHTENEIKKMLEPKISEVTTAILKDLTY